MKKAILNGMLAIITIPVILSLSSCKTSGNTDKGNADDTPQIVERNYNGHEYVDLGLPSGIKWATCNIGATKPEEYGDYFSWGSTTPFIDEKGDNRCTIFKKSLSDLQAAGIINEEGVLNPRYDAARTHWGGTWRMPTHNEIYELCEKCTWEWIDGDSISGYKITGKNGRSIFLPAAGHMMLHTYYDGINGHYWSNTTISDYHAINLMFSEEGKATITFEAEYGCPIRAVSE